MKLSIWQQFSSNHSASYTVVGEFQSATQANDAFNEVMTIMSENYDWYVAHNEYPRKRKEPTPIELKYSRQYGFDWRESVDWARYNFEQAILYYDRIVVIKAGGGVSDTWQTGHQFVNLLKAMGAKVGQSVMEGREPDKKEEVRLGMRFKINCQAATDATASKLVKHFQDVFEAIKSDDDKGAISWIIHHPDLLTSSYQADEIRQLQEDYLRDSALASQIHKENPSNNQIFHQLWAEVRKLSHEDWVWIGQIRRDVNFFGGEVIQEGNQLVFTNLNPYNIVVGLKSFILYLEQLGCSNITYTVEQL